MARITLDLETFKALASPTRLDVLRALDERRKTGTELATQLGLNKATVHEHLKVLAATGLVTRQDDGRKWVYWELSWSGRKLLHPNESTAFAVMLGLGLAAAGGSVVQAGRVLGWWWANNRQSAGAGEETLGDEGLYRDTGAAATPPFTGGPASDADATPPATAHADDADAGDGDGGAEGAAPEDTGGGGASPQGGDSTGDDTAGDETAGDDTAGGGDGAGSGAPANDGQAADDGGMGDDDSAMDGDDSADDSLMSTGRDDAESADGLSELADGSADFGGGDSPTGDAESMGGGLFDLVPDGDVLLAIMFLTFAALLIVLAVRMRTRWR